QGSREPTLTPDPSTPGFSDKTCHGSRNASLRRSNECQPSPQLAQGRGKRSALRGAWCYDGTLCLVGARGIMEPRAHILLRVRGHCGTLLTQSWPRESVEGLLRAAMAQHEHH